MGNILNKKNKISNSSEEYVIDQFMEKIADYMTSRKLSGIIVYRCPLCRVNVINAISHKNKYKVQECMICFNEIECASFCCNTCRGAICVACKLKLKLVG